MTEREKLIELIQNAVNGCARHWAEVIADYLLSNGVIVLPCKAGDTVYSLAVQGVEHNRTLLEGKVKRFAFNKDDRFCVDIAFVNGFVWRYFPEHFGKNLFLTKEEAEKALKERKKV